MKVRVGAGSILEGSLAGVATSQAVIAFQVRIGQNRSAVIGPSPVIGAWTLSLEGVWDKHRQLTLACSIVSNCGTSWLGDVSFKTKKRGAVDIFGVQTAPAGACADLLCSCTVVNLTCLQTREEEDEKSMHPVEPPALVYMNDTEIPNISTTHFQSLLTNSGELKGFVQGFEAELFGSSEAAGNLEFQFQASPDDPPSNVLSFTVTPGAWGATVTAAAIDNHRMQINMEFSSGDQDAVSGNTIMVSSSDQSSDSLSFFDLRARAEMIRTTLDGLYVTEGLSTRVKEDHKESASSVEETVLAVYTPSTITAQGDHVRHVILSASNLVASEGAVTWVVIRLRARSRVQSSGVFARYSWANWLLRIRTADGATDEINLQPGRSRIVFFEDQTFVARLAIALYKTPEGSLTADTDLLGFTNQRHQTRGTVLTSLLPGQRFAVQLVTSVNGRPGTNLGITFEDIQGIVSET